MKINVVVLAILIALPALPQEPQFAPGGAPKAAAPKPAAPAKPNFFGLAPPPDPAAVQRGQGLFVASCGFCHGSSGKGGNAGPDLVRSVLVLHDEGSGKEVGPVILNGRPSKGMPKFTMTPAQIMDISAFLLSLSQGAVNRGDYKILDVVTGNPKEGKVYFDKRCAGCHSPKGDLAHLADRYDPVALQSRFLYPKTRLTPKGQTTVVVTLPSGEKFSGQLGDIDDFSVSLTESTGQYKSWTLTESNGIKVQVNDPLKGHEELLKEYSDADMHNILSYLVTFK
ncbi:MAG: c-type cytochrome [Bryobacteraceae bacterium]